MSSSAQTPDADWPPGTARRSDRLFRWRWARRWVPLLYREEFYEVLCLTGPLLISRILHFLLSFVITLFCGRLGNTELAGYALASATINVTTAATGGGLALACDTLVSQTYGGKNLKRVGEVLQRSILILLLFCLPCWSLLINTESILLRLWQDPQVARYTQLYMIAFLPAVPALFLHQLQVSYLQNQGIILPQMYTAAAANVLNVATNYILLIWLDLGVKGSAAANSLSQIYICLLLFLYIRWKQLHRKTWAGWSSAALQEWGAYMRLALPSTLMLCFEWWLYEIGGFLAGMLGELDVAAQHIVITLAFVTYMFPLGVQVAACFRVGNSLGAGDTARAIVTSKVSLILAGIFAVFEGIILGSTKSVIGFIFTADKAIVELVSQILSVYVILQFFDGLVCVSLGIILGTGKQKIAAGANLIAYYCIGLPLGVSLMFKAGLRVPGMWLGLLICVILLSSFFIFVLIFKFNWVKITEEAKVRAGKNVGNRSMDRRLADGVIQDSRTIPEDGHTTLSATPASHTNGYIAVRNQEQGVATVGPEDGSPAVLLSVPQLLFRRGLTLLAALLILAAGLTVHLTVPVPLLLLESNLTLAVDNTSAPTVLLSPTMFT
ncbi:solute carrier family 47 member 4 isoform X1 [Paramormyrops kingsleyae]|uniref:solute carrier family 47 member 4 isoform X1 n=1 Tax=Paramormyrops kingsleyae TaxID=1676925 RepID=UPI003B9733C9